MRRNPVIVLYLLAMVTVVVGADFALFRHRFVERLVANVIIVVAFVAFFLYSRRR